MKEYTATLHAYEITTPPRCKLERLEPVTEEITLQLHYAESAPVAMRTAGGLDYTGSDGTRRTYRSEPIELLALDGMLWRRDDYRPGEWTLEELARIVDDHNVLERWPYQYRSDAEPPRGLLVRDRGEWGTVDSQRADLLEHCDRYAAIGGDLYRPARELVYSYDRISEWRGGDGGRVVAAEEYNPGETWKNWLCNALQDWREVNIFDEYAERIQDKLMSEVTGADTIEVLLPGYVTADPYADFWRREIEQAQARAASCKQAARDHEAAAKSLHADARKDREAARRYMDKAEEYAEKLADYLAGKEA